LFRWQLYGVSWTTKSGGKWQVQLSIPGAKRFKEYFADEVVAGKKYDELVSAAKESWGGGYNTS
jgi:hypothetical protein